MVADDSEAFSTLFAQLQDDDDTLINPSLEYRVRQPTDRAAAAAYSETEDDEDDTLQVNAKSHPSDVDRVCIQRSDMYGCRLYLE